MSKKLINALQILLSIALLASMVYHFWPQIVADPVLTPQVVNFACTTDLGPDEYEYRLINEYGQEEVERKTLDENHPFDSYGPAIGDYYLGITVGGNVTMEFPNVNQAGFILSECPTTKWLEVVIDNTSHIDFRYSPQP